MDAETLATALPSGHYAILTRDHTVIALALAQLIEEGAVSPAIHELALLAIERESTAVVIEFREWRDPAERLSRLRVMRQVLEAAQTSDGA